MPVVEGGGGATRRPNVRTGPGGQKRPGPAPADSAVDRYLDSIRTDSDMSRDEGGFGWRVTPYAISASMWKTWAAAAGYPGASINDPTVVNKVASWAASSLYNELGNWGLVAIGWRYGAAAAREIRDFFGGKLDADMVSSIMGKDGASFVNKVMTQMYDAHYQQQLQQMMLDNSYDGFDMPTGSGPGGELELRITEEEFPEPNGNEERDPAQMALMHVLGMMADAVAGGRRHTVENVEPSMIPEDTLQEEIPTPVPEEDTQMMEAQA